MSANSPGTAPLPSRADTWGAILVALAAWIALMATERDFGMVWDEGYTIRRERVLDGWFSRMGMPPRAGAFSTAELDRSWPFSREEPDGHPPFYALLGLAGWWLTRHVLNPLSAHRFGPMVLAAATAGVLYLHLARRTGRLSGLAAAALFLLMPRPFAHAHYAHYDMPMTCLWLLAQVAFVASLRSSRWIVAFGVCLGLAAGTKFTGLFALAPPALWVFAVEIVPALWRRAGVLRGPKPGLRALALGLPAAVATLYAIQPPWWVAPVSGPWRFLVSNLTRAKTKPLPTLYLGRVYEFSLPWHNAIVLTAVTTPLVVLALAGLGVAACIARRKTEPWSLLWPLSWSVLVVVRALPMTPGHDGVRLFLPSVASLAVLAGLGVGWVASRRRGRWIAAVLVAAAVGECLVGIARTYPYTDSYFNAAVGGLPGAERAGFELTYYWETSGPEFLDWVRREMRTHPVELNFTMDETNHRILRAWGVIPHSVRILGLDKAARPDYVQQRRRAFFYPEDWWLERHGHPKFVIRREGVDLLRVYPFEEWREACRVTFHDPLPPHLNR